MTRVFNLIWETLREIFDEAAYERYLQSTGRLRSRESFAAFMDATRTARETKVRCC